eukprot:s3405_g1.t2
MPPPEPAEPAEPAEHVAPAREGSRLSEAVILDDQHHKDFATVWSSVWFRTQVKPPQLGRELTNSGDDDDDDDDEIWGWPNTTANLSENELLGITSLHPGFFPGHHKDPGKALQLVVASSGLMPAWLPESLDVEDEERSKRRNQWPAYLHVSVLLKRSHGFDLILQDDLSDALGQVTGTVFRHWCHARESEIRVDDLLLILGDLGIEAHQEISELLEQALAGNIYATLDWPDFVSLLKDYRRLERQYHRKLFEVEMTSEGSVSVEVLLDRLGHPAALQAFDKCRTDRTRQLRLTEGFSQHDLRELHAFFEVEKTSEWLRKDGLWDGKNGREPMCRCSLEKVQQVMMLRGFPTTEEEVQQMAEKLGFSSEHGVRFRQMLRLIRCLKDLERTQMLEIIQKYSQERRNAIQVVDLPLALGGLGYYPDEDAIKEHLGAIGARESEECLTPEELARFLQKYRQVQYHNLAQSFSKADKTKRGQLNALELTEVLRRAGFHDVIQALYHFDLEGIGLLSLPEVLKLLRGLLAKEAETRRNAFLAACRGPAQKLPARDLAATIARVRGYQPDKTVLASMLSILGLHSMGLSFTAFEHVCKLMRESDVKFMQNHSGYTPEQVAELKVHYQSYDPDDRGFIPGAKLPQLFLDAFPMYSTSTRQQQITKNYVEEVNQTSNGWTFEAFLGFVRMAEDEACHQDLLDEETTWLNNREQLVQDHDLRAEECRGFREIFISKADHNCAVTDEDILDMFDFATAEFNQEQRMKFFQVLKEVDRHYYGTALRFPDFLRFMKRLTEKHTEENLGLVRASLRLKRLEDEAEAWARACRVVKRGMSRSLIAEDERQLLQWLLAPLVIALPVTSAEQRLEHILLRPDTYVGSTEVQHQELWVFDSVQSRMVYRKISYVPALYKIFDEILVNAADNLQRDPQGMDSIKVEIDPQNNSISVWNNGRGLPVVMHKEQKVYVPELVFGHLLTSDNYDDTACKVVGGRNGYGAKLANVFSTEFKVETCDGKNRFTQVFRNNMQAKGKPDIVPSKEKSFTCITFKPDLAKFGMTKLDDDIVSLLSKRVYDVAGSTLEKCGVHLNGEKLDIKNFRDYCDLYLLTRQGVPQIYEKCSDRWEICVSLTESGFNQVSFVNSICTIRGGTHVTHVSDQIVEAILEKVKAQSKEKVKGGVDVKPHHVRNHIWVFIKCLIENPAFDSQTKETLTTKQSKFGSRCELSEKFLNEVSTCGVVDLILMAAMAKSKVDLGKKLKANTSRVTRLTGIPKLEDANDAGGKLSSECSLILTEGDSAKAADKGR